MYSTMLSVPKIEINFDTPNRDHFLREEFPSRNGYTVLGRGSYGVVIKARYKGKAVAVKIVERHKKHRFRYDSIRSEANIVNIKHENIVRVLKIITGAQYGLVIMERFDGECLQTVLNQRRILSVHHQLLILCDIINGLCFCHRHHIVHLDIKPQNVIVCLLVPNRSNKDFPCKHVRNYTCKLCDFGSSIILDNFNLNERSRNRGTIRYMAPELLREMGSVSELADIYSFGITMWQLVEGKDPYESIVSNESVAYNVVKKKLRPDSVTTAEILRIDSSLAPPTGRPSCMQLSFRARKVSDNELNVPLSYYKSTGNSHISFHSSILSSSNASGQKPTIESAATAAAVADVLKQQGIDMVEQSLAEKKLLNYGTAMEGDAFETANVDTFGGLFAQNFEIEAVDLNYIRQEYRALYRKCWQHEVAARPSAGDVRISLHEMMERIVCCK